MQEMSLSILFISMTDSCSLAKYLYPVTAQMVPSLHFFFHLLSVLHSSGTHQHSIRLITRRHKENRTTLALVWRKYCDVCVNVNANDFISDSSSNRIQFQAKGTAAEAAFSTLYYSSPLHCFLCVYIWNHMWRINVRPPEGDGGARFGPTWHCAEKESRSQSLVKLAHVHLHLLISREQKSNEVNVLHYNIHEAVGHPSRVQAEADINTLNLGPEPFGPSGE